MTCKHRVGPPGNNGEGTPVCSEFHPHGRDVGSSWLHTDEILSFYFLGAYGIGELLILVVSISRKANQCRFERH